MDFLLLMTMQKKPTVCMILLIYNYLAKFSINFGCISFCFYHLDAKNLPVKYENYLAKQSIKKHPTRAKRLQTKSSQAIK